MARYILCDIEGTTTSIAFVHETLFPYARTHIADFVRSNHDDPAVKEALRLVEQTLKEEKGFTGPDLEASITALLEWIDTDRKHTGLKTLQGLLWEAGYANGGYTGHIYADVLPAFQRWQAAGIGIGIYSSGSVRAQQLLFQHTTEGDLSAYLQHHFDTRMGHKKEAPSYARIQQEIGMPAGEILFLSDVPAELDAAAAAGFQTLQLLRPGTPAGSGHRTASDFDEILP